MGKLVLVPTPIGNLEDITLRALRILKESDLILAEDTRTTGNLLKHYEIQKRLISYHQYNEHQKLQEFVNQIENLNLVSLVTDAGTPGISDPGFMLIRECIRQEIEVECLPGPTALIPALVVSGFPPQPFHFEGFLPMKKGRQSRLAELAEYSQTLVFYESPHRLVKTLQQFITFFGQERKVSISRELTKMYEETFRGSVQEACRYFSEKMVKGELVIIVEGKNK